MNGKDHSFDALRAGEFRVEDIPDGGASALVRMAAGAGEASGIAYTSTGALAVRALRAAEGGAAVTATSGGDVDLNTVYELRLWRVVDSGASAAGGVVAQELRWLNGFGAVRVTVTDSPAATDQVLVPPGCWYRRTEYLQHQGAGPADGGGSGPATGRGPGAARPVMACVEVFQSESEYSNTVFVDQIMTGRWN